MFGSDLMWLICHLALTQTRFPCVYDVAISMPTYRGGSPWKSSLSDQVSNRAFSKFKDVFVSTLSLSLSLTLTPTPSHSHINLSILTLTQTDPLSHQKPVADPLSSCQPHPRRPSLTLSLSHSPTQSHASVSHLFHPHTDILAKRTEMYETVITEL